jgi:hypothetical protein
MINIHEIKALLQIEEDDETYDIFLETILPSLEEFVCTYTGKTFLNASNEVELPKGILPIVAKMAQYDMKDVSVNSQSVGNFRTQYNTQYPPHIMIMLDKYVDRAVKFM